MLCLAITVQTTLPAAAEEFIIYDEAGETVLVEDDTWDDSAREDLIVDDGLLEDASPEISGGDGVGAGQIEGLGQVEAENGQADSEQVNREQVNKEHDGAAATDPGTEIPESETQETEDGWETETSREVQESEVGSEAGTENGAGLEETEEDSEKSSEELLEEESETETEGLLEGDLDKELETIVLVETVELADETVFSNGASGRARTFRLAQYDGCFGNQLSGFALELYNQRVNYYVTNQNTGSMTVIRDVNSSPYTFTAATYKNENNETKIDTSTDEYKEFYNLIRYDMQSSIDAFLYDHPEVFWLRSGTYTVYVGAVGSPSSGYVGFLKQITYTPKVAYSGAASQIFAYEKAVANAVAQVYEAANADGQCTNLELIKYAHDYLCERLYYDTPAYETYLAKTAEKEAAESAGGTWDGEIDYRIFSSAGAFMDSVGTGVVCEGYAKGFKVLCDKMGIPCVLIGGKVQQSSGTEGHMWNGVKINGKWYLMDVTWDDTSSTDHYFLVGDITEGRTSTGNFMGAEYTTTFVYPTLETDAFDYVNVDGVLHATTEINVVEPTCIAQGYTDHFCTDEGCGYFYRDTYTAVNNENHSLRPRKEQKEATCTTQGYTVGVCGLCGEEIEKRVYTDALGHSYKSVTTKPTCISQGYTTYTCTRGGCGYSYVADYTEDPDNHNYQKTKAVAPTCMAKGYTVYTCSRCQASYNSTYVNALGHTYSSVVTAPTHLTGGYTTYTCTRPGCGYSYRGNQTAAVKAHTYKNGICTICGVGDTIVNAAISKISTQGYDPKGAKPSVTVKFGTNVLKEGTDYKVTYRNNTAIGTAWAKITGIGKYRGTVSKSFKIIKRSVNKLTFPILKDRTYNGKSQKPSLTIRNNGTKLTYKKDYTVTYSKNKNVGRAVITVKFKGNYSGTKKLYFHILPKAVSLSTVKSTARKKMKVTWKKVSGGSSYQVQYSLKSNFSGAKTVTAGSGSSSKTISKLASKKTYYVRIRSYKKVSGKTYYSAWSKAKKVRVK